MDKGVRLLQLKGVRLLQLTPPQARKKSAWVGLLGYRLGLGFGFGVFFVGCSYSIYISVE